MIKTIITSVLLALSTATWAQSRAEGVTPYALNFPTSLTTSYAGRALTGFALSGDDGHSGAVTGLPTGTPRPVYHDCTTQTITVGRGTIVTPQVQAQYSTWMHAYLYVDWNRDSTFQTTPDELLTYTCYEGKNSPGQSVQMGVALSQFPAFNIPQEADGVYRARLVIDWNCKDPGGRYGSKYTDNFINDNGGAVMDFHLNVTDRARLCYLNLDTRHGNVYDASGNPLPHKITGVKEIKFKPVAVATGYELDGPITVTNDTATYTFEKLGTYTVPVCGDMTIKAHFRPTAKAKWICSFDDEFEQPDGSGPDLTKWKYCQRANPTWKRYVSQDPRDSVCVVRGGMMSLLCKPNPKKTGDADAMLSGALETSDSYNFTYGKVEIRAKVIPHKGNFPALWMMPKDQHLGWPDCGEIDIFEQIDNSNTAYHTIHSRWGNTLGHSNDPSKGGTSTIDLDRFHTYGLEWDATQLKWYVDGKQTFTYSRVASHDNEADGQWPFNKDFYLIINQSVGNGTWAAQADYKYTYEMLVDWVRVYKSGQLIDLSTDNTDKNYVTYTDPISVTTSRPLTVRTARYTEFKPVVKGKGDMSLYCGGERTFAGAKDDKSYPDWSGHTGDVHIYPYTEVKKDCGFYGLILNSGGKTFNPEDIAGSLPTTNSQLLNNHVTLHDGATLATTNGVRAARIGTLNTEAGSQMVGPMKASNGYAGYYVLGASNEDATLAGRIAPQDAKAKVGIVKEGTGTYTITGNDNLINGAIRVLEGTVQLANDVSAARSGKKAGAIGAVGKDTPGMYVFEGATVSGNGHSASIIDLYGTMNPGTGGTGTLTLADFASGAAVDLRLRPTSQLKFDISSSIKYDRIDVSGALNYWNITQGFATSDDTPIIYILLDESAKLRVGNTFTLITASGKTARNGNAWNFRIKYPKRYTWEVKENEADGVYTLTATVTSLEYSGQGDETQGGNDDPQNPGDEEEDDGFDETTDPTPLRTYAEALGKHIGVAAPCWSYDINNYSDPNTQIIGREFNMVVSENGMKFENTEQSNNSFNYSLGDKAMNLGLHYGQVIRGHVFAWHKQNGAWITENDNKNSHGYSRDELLAILKNHIFKVAAHYKGKVTEWDVVNECLSDDQTAIRNNPDAYDLRHSVWMDGIGEDFIDSAFVWAHEADPSLKLYLTDYGVEFKGTAKTEALYNLAKRLLADNIPLHGVGLQCHLDAGAVDEQKLSQTVESYKTLGLECIITECDMGCDGTTAGLEQQAKDYAAVARVWLGHDNCPSLVIWGLKDSDSWRGTSPLLYRLDCSAKPAYYAIHRVLRRAHKKLLDAIEAPSAAITKDSKTYNLQGIEVSDNYHGIVIQNGKKLLRK